MLVGRLVGGGVLDVRVLRSRALSLAILNVFGVLGVLVRLVSPRFLGRFSGLRAVLVGRLVGGGVLVRVLRSRALSLGILGALGVLGRLVCLLFVTGLARVVGVRALFGGIRSRSPRVTRATSSTGGRVVGQVAARPEVGEDLDVPGTGQPAEQVGIGGRVSRQRRPQVGPALCDGGLQGLVRSLSGNRRIGLMRRHHELNRIHAEPSRENVWVTSTDRARSQPIPGPSPGSDHPRW